MRSGSTRLRWLPRVADSGALRFGCGLFLPLAGGLCACEDEHTIEDTVDARPGVEQVGSADGPLLDEAEACESLRDALLDARSDNGCEDEVAVPVCPDLIRPGGSLACVRYSQESIDECASRAEAYESCGDFVSDACIVVAVVSEMSEGCVPPGAADSGADDDVDAGGGDDVSDDDDPAMDGQPDAATSAPSADGDAGNEPDSGAEEVADAGMSTLDSGSSDSGLDDGPALDDAGTPAVDVSDSGTGDAGDAAL